MSDKSVSAAVAAICKDRYGVDMILFHAQH
jgi:hypothetical protein